MTPAGPPGRQRTRPRPIRIRSSRSPNRAWRGARVLDLFAGAGTLGIEALSRGARVRVVRRARGARRAAAELETTGFAGRDRGARRRGPLRSGGPYDSSLRPAVRRRRRASRALLARPAIRGARARMLVLARTGRAPTSPASPAWSASASSARRCSVSLEYDAADADLVGG